MKIATSSSRPDEPASRIASDRIGGAPADFERLQLRIARRADELAASGLARVTNGEARRLWIKAEHEILGSDSRVALADLLRLIATLSRG